MSFGGGFFGGGTKTTKQTVVTTNIAQDQRIMVGGSAGTLVAPGATLTQTITGMPASDVRGLLDEILGQQGASTRQLADIVAATKAPEQTALTSMLPWLLLGFFLLLMWGR